MYNRYTPQPDGSYRRSPAPEDPRPPAPSSNPPSTPNPPPGPGGGPLGIGNFFRQLLPGGLDTEDLLVVLLLLLLSPDPGENQSWALLTLALYLFL